MALELTQRFRRQVAPYDVVSSLALLTGSNYCPALQTVGADGLPDIDRASCPTVLQAVVAANSSDGSGSVASVASDSITNVKWMVQGGGETKGTDITLHSEWAGKFSIGTGADKGKLTVSMNISPGASWLIWMSCVINDSRRGYVVAIPVVTEAVQLYSISSGVEIYGMSLDRPAGEVYEPATDARLIYEYLSGLDMAPAQLTDDGNTYLRPVTAALRKGGEDVDVSGYTVRVFRMGTTGTRTEVTAASDDCISSISGNVVTFDLRFSTGATYQIACYVGGREVCRKTYGWAWSDAMPATDEGIIGASTYADASEQTYRVKLNLGRGLLRYPLVAYNMQWGYRDLSNDTLTYIGAGEQQTYDLGATPSLGGLSEVVLSVSKRGAFSYLATAASGGARYVDGNGNYYVEN